MGPEDAEYAFPEVVLNFIRHLVPGDIKGEIREVSDFLLVKSASSKLVACINIKMRLIKFQDVGHSINQMLFSKRLCLRDVGIIPLHKHLKCHTRNLLCFCHTLVLKILKFSLVRMLSK